MMIIFYGNFQFFFCLYFSIFFSSFFQVVHTLNISLGFKGNTSIDELFR